MRNGLVKYLVIGLVGVACVQGVVAQKVKAVRDPGSANMLSVKKAVNLPQGDLAEKIEKYPSGKSTLAESPDRIRQAFVFCVSSGSKEVPSCVQRVFVTDLGTDETYEIKGEELFIEANRTVENLKWINNTSLSYERWAGPHFGHRYIVDVKEMKQTGAFALTDQ